MDTFLVVESLFEAPHRSNPVSVDRNGEADED
jgi:hypothetical protein